MKILISGGHLSPALCIIENLKNEEIFYIGRKYAMEGDKALSLEYQAINKLNIPFYEISPARLQRKFTKYTIPSLFKLPSGFFQATKAIRAIKPDVVIGFGGYVSVPVIFAAFLLKIPTVIHEQTLEVGLANKLLFRFATIICISWKTNTKFFPPHKTVVTGLPIKKEITNVVRKKHDGVVLYITGGSLGSHTINSLVEQVLPKLLENFTIVHQTGDAKNFNDFERLSDLKKNLKQDLSKKYTLKKFLHGEEITQILGSADIVVSRAGINTVSELLYLQIPSFLIPIHFSQRNEQLKNAIFLKDAGLASIGDETSLVPEQFLDTLLTMKQNLSSYKIKSRESLLDDKASIKIINVLKDVARKKKT